MRCLSCEIHAVYRVALRFTKEAIVSGIYTNPMQEIKKKFGFNNINVDFQNDNNRFPAIAIMLIDVKMPNSQKRTVTKTAKEIKSLIDSDMLEEGFIEIHEVSDVVQLIDWEEKKSSCKPKPKKKPKS